MDKKKIISIVIFVIGLITLVVGVVFLILHLNSGPNIQDGEYLVSAKEWILSDGTECNESTANEGEQTGCPSSVIWKFTEIGKGTLTTNNHLNDYDFAWAIEDGKLKIETNWLYDLENEYEYTINQNDGILTLTDGDKTIIFAANFETE